MVESTGESYGSRESVADYVAGVLHEPRSSGSRLAMSVSASRSEPRSVSYDRDRWDRYRLADHVEIHVRRPPVARNQPPRGKAVQGRAEHPRRRTVKEITMTFEAIPDRTSAAAISE